MSKLVVIVGETGSGKSALAMEVARRFNGEIINADSRAVYKGMDIGTAKPTAAEQAEIPHHLLDVVEPGEPFTAAQFKQLALAAIEDIAARGKLPVMAGGTGLYVDSVLFDYQFGSEADPAERARLNVLSLEQLQAEAEHLEPAPYTRENRRHLIRLIENAGQVEQAKVLRPDTLVVGLSLSRTQLRKRIEERVEQMFKRGLRHEVEELAARYGWESEAMTGIGYREFRDFHEGRASMGEVKRRIAQNTLSKLAKNQRTWFKRNQQIEWFDDPAEALEQINDWLGR